jgi:hypothetical protein
MATETSIRPAGIEAERAVNEALRERLSGHGFERATVVADEDHDGTEVLYVDVDFGLTDTPVDPNMVVGLTQIVREALATVGETRYPIVRHHFDARQKVAGWR